MNFYVLLLTKVVSRRTKKVQIAKKKIGSNPDKAENFHKPSKHQS